MRNKNRLTSDTDVSRDILKCLKTHGNLKRREIADILRIKGDGRIALKQALQELENTGKIKKERKEYTLAGQLPAVLPLKVTGQDEDGRYLAEPLSDRFGTDHTIIVSDKKLKKIVKGGVLKTAQALLARLTPATDPENGQTIYIADVIKSLESSSDSFFGTVDLAKERWVLKPIVKKWSDRLFTIDNLDALDAQNATNPQSNIFVAVIPKKEDRRRGGRRDASVRIEKVLGPIEDARHYSSIAIAEHNLSTTFSEAVEAHAKDYTPKQAKNRQDWREMNFVTIDPIDARDHDDAVFAHADTDPKNAGGHIIYVAIADVSAYVPEASVIDKEAYARGNSVYFPDGVVPMLPHALSSNQCSLKPHVERDVFGVKLRVDKTGQLLSYTFARATIISKANMAYEAAQAFWDNGRSEHEDITNNQALRQSLQDLKAANDTLLKARATRAPLNITTKEQRIRVNNDTGEVTVTDVPHLYAHQLIENMMVLANEAAARKLHDAKSAGLNRIHDAPDPQKMDDLRNALKTMGLNLPKGQHLEPKHFNSVLDKVKDTPQQHLISELVLRSQSQAKYSPETIGHFGLNLRFYAHFTSPIRRYADVITHRLLLQTLGETDGASYDINELKQMGEHLSSRERIAQAAERDTIDRLRIKGLEGAIGEVTTATISGLTRFGVFAELASEAEGFIPMRTLRTKGFRINDSASTLYAPKRKGKKTTSFRMGDTIRVKIEEVHPLAGALKLSIVL